MSLFRAFIPLTLFICFSAPSFSAEKEKMQVPLLLDLGLGFGRFKSEVDITSNDQSVYVFKPFLAGSVEADTIKSLKHKLPKDAPEWLQNTELTYSPLPLPDSIYFTQSEDGSDKVFGLSIGPSLSVGGGLTFLTVSAGVGLRATYLYIENDLFDENHFLSLGALASYNITFKPVRYFHIEVGQQHSWHIEDQLSNNEYLGRFTENYAMLHFRFPYTADVKL